MIFLDTLTDADLDAVLAVAGGDDGASLEGLSANGQAAVTAAFAVKGVKVPPGYWNPPAAAKKAPAGRDYELAILDRQDRYYDSL